MLHIDLPTPAEFRILSQTRADACVATYLPTTPLSQSAQADRIALHNLLKTAIAQLEAADFDKRRLATLREGIEDVVDDDDFWTVQANSLAVLATPDHVRTFRLANALLPQVEVSGRFHLKPLLRAVTFPQVALVLALSENGTRLVEVPAEGPAVTLRIPDLPTDASSAAGRASINDRSPSGRIQGSEGKKIRLTQFARKVDAALRPAVAGMHAPLFLAGTEPLTSIFRAVSTLADLAPNTIEGNHDRSTDADLARAARPLLDAFNAATLADIRATFEARRNDGRATTDLADAARAAAIGAIDSLLVDIDAVVPGTYNEATGAITLADAPSAQTYGVVDAVAAQALATGARVLGVRKPDLPDNALLAAVLRFAA